MVSQDPQPPDSLNKYEKIKRILENSYLYAIIVIATGAIIFAANFFGALKIVKNFIWPETKIIMTVTVENGTECPIVGKKMSTLSVLINNNSDRAELLTSVKLILDKVEDCGFYLGESKVVGTYDVSLKPWYDVIRKVIAEPDSHDSPLRAGTIWKNKDGSFSGKLDPIKVTEIVSKKFVVDKHSREHFHIKMGLARSIEYLKGKIFLEIETDNGVKLTFKGLDISICEVPTKGK